MKFRPLIHRRLGLTAAMLTAMAGTGVFFYAHSRKAFQHADRIYVIGTDNAYPYHSIDGSGKAAGMIGEAIQEAARRSGIRIEWRLHPEGPTKALTSAAVDLWPLLGSQAATAGFHSTEPYLRNTYTILAIDPQFTASDGFAKIRRLGMGKYPATTRLAKREFPGAEAVPEASREAALSALCRGKTDAIVLESRSAQHLALSRPPGCQQKPLHAAGLNVPPAEQGIASTNEAAPAAELLRREIDGMLADGTMARILRRWNYYYGDEAEAMFREKEARAANRLSRMLSAVLGVLSFLLLVLLVRVRRAQQAAIAANAAKSQFLANMSHEIRTPLHGIIGVGQILAETPLGAEQRDFLELSLGSSRALLGIVNDLLDLARIERGHLELQHVVFEPAAVITDAVRVFQIQARTKGIALQLTGLDSLPPLLCADSARLRQILVNLLGNAMKFTLEGSVTVRIETQILDKAINLDLTIADTGIGMSAESQKKLFEKFYQAGPSISRRFGGTGLGLAITKELVQAMGGTIQVQSEEGTGSQFTVSLPLALPTAEEAEATLAPAARACQTDIRSLKILLAEDNLVNQRIVKRLVEGAGHSVVAVADGASAILYWESGLFDVILMDCQMPGMDGFEASGEIRKREIGTRRIPIIALTAAAMQGDRERCIAAGMDDYLTKPLDMKDLHRALNACTIPAPAIPGL